jgi:hypothetical protein
LVISTGTAISILPRPLPMTTRLRGTRTQLNVVHREAGSVMEPFVRAILVTIWSHPSVHVNRARLVVTVIKPTKADASKIALPVRFRLKWVSLPLHNAKDGARPVPFRMNLVLVQVQNAKGAPPVRFRMSLVLLQVCNAKDDAPPVPFRMKLVFLQVRNAKVNAPRVHSLPKSVKQHKPHAKVDAQPVRSLPKWVWMPVHNVNDAPPVHSLLKSVKQEATRVKVAPLIITIRKKEEVRAHIAQVVGTPFFQNQLPAVTFTTTPDALKASFQPKNPQYHCTAQIVRPEPFLPLLAKCFPAVANAHLEDIHWHRDFTPLTSVLNVHPNFIRKPLEHRPMSASIAPVVSLPTRSWDPPNAAQWTFLCLYGL